MQVPRLLVAALVGMTLPNVFVLWNSRAGAFLGYGDFAVFYSTGTLIRRGQGRQIYERDAQWNVQQEFASQVENRRGPLRFIRPPYEALVFACFAGWPYRTSLLIWTAFKLLLLAAIPLFCMRRGPGQDRIPPWAVGILGLGTFPVFLDFLLGQDAVLLAFLFAVAYWQLGRDRDGWAGFTLGLGLFKFNLVLPFVLIVWLGGRKRIAWGFGSAAVGVVALSAAVVGWAQLLRYPAYLMTLNQMSGVGVITAAKQINFRGLLTPLVGRSPYPGPAHWVLLPVAVVAIAFAGRTWRRQQALLAEGFALALITAILFTYYSCVYDLVLLAVPFLAMQSGDGDRSQADPWARFCETAGTALLLFTPLYWVLLLRMDAEFLLTIPLLAVSFAMVRRLRRATTRSVLDPLQREGTG